MSRIEATKVLLDDESILGPAAMIGEARGNKTLAKTVRDLLREKIVEIQIKGDPNAKRLPAPSDPQPAALAS